METLYQILTFVFGGTSVVGTLLSIIWWRQTKRLKEAEVKQKEVEAEKGEAEATEIEDRIPPNDKLKGLKYDPPKRAVK